MNLQSVNCGLIEAMKYIDIVLHEIHDMRSNMDITFSKIFKNAKTFIKSTDDKEDVRKIGVQTKELLRESVNIK